MNIDFTLPQQLAEDLAEYLDQEGGWEPIVKVLLDAIPYEDPNPWQLPGWANKFIVGNNSEPLSGYLTRDYANGQWWALRNPPHTCTHATAIYWQSAREDEVHDVIAWYNHTGMRRVIDRSAMD